MNCSIIGVAAPTAAGALPSMRIGVSSFIRVPEKRSFPLLGALRRRSVALIPNAPQKETKHTPPGGQGKQAREPWRRKPTTPARPSARRRRWSSTPWAGRASWRSTRPSRWRRSATSRSPIRRASPCRSGPSPRTRPAPSTTRRAATWSPSSPTAPRSSASAISARSPPSR